MSMMPRSPAPPCLVLLPGLDGTGQTFAPFLAERPVGMDTEVIGYPGDQPLDYDALLELVWERLPRDRSYFLLGESFSGPLAVRAAARRPPGLRGVILCASFINSPTPWLFRRYPFLFTPQVVQRLIRIESQVMRVVLGKRRDPLGHRAGRIHRNVCPAVVAARVRATMTVDVSRELQQLEQPLMYLAGRWDMVVPGRCRRLIQRLRPDSQLKILNGPHALLQTRPREAWAVVRDWVAEIEEFPEAVTIPATATDSLLEVRSA